MSKLDDPKLVMEAFRRLVAERGEDFVYGLERRKEKAKALGGVYDPGSPYMSLENPLITCHYATKDGSLPDCAVGAIAFELDRKFFDHYLRGSDNTIADILNSYNAEIDMGRDAIAILQYIQTLQDEGLPYGKVLMRVESAYATLQSVR